jgi:branched-chain amino acid transport system permease protein
VLWGGLLLGVVEAHAQSLLGAQGREFATYALLFAVLVWPRRSLADRAERTAPGTPVSAAPGGGGSRP